MVDNKAVASRKMRDIAETVAKGKGIPLQLAVTGGSTDAAAIQEHGALMIPIGVPVRYTHSTVEVCSLKDMEKCVELIVGMVKEILA